MNTRTPSSAAHSNGAADCHAAWAARMLERQVERLDRLAEAGTELALAIQAAAIDDPDRHEATAKSFARVKRSVRLAGLLQARLLADLQRMRSWDQVQAEQAREAAERQAAEDRAKADPAYAHKARVEAVIARVAKASTGDEERVERLVMEAGERLDDDDIYGDVLTRPVGELVALICRDLDLEPDWPRLAEEAWALEEMGNPRSPFRPASPQGGEGRVRGPSKECGPQSGPPHLPTPEAWAPSSPRWGEDIRSDPPDRSSSSLFP